MAKLRAKLIVSDFDGTLINTNDVIIEAWQYTYSHYGRPEQPVEYITKFFGEPLLITMAREFPEVDPTESAEVYRQRQREMAPRLVSIFPGTEDLLKALRERGYKTGIVTSRTRESTLSYLDMFGIAGYFDDIVTCDDTDKHKPDPEPALLGLAKLDAGPEEAVMIGDSLFDMKCAGGAGIRTVLVGWAVTGASEDMEDCCVDYTISEPMELMEILEGL